MTVFQETVRAVKEEYPKFSNACLSLSMRSYETGVQMTPRAQKIADAVERSETLWKRRSDKRVKSISFRCRLAPALAGVVKNKLEAEGLTQQELLERLLLEWVKESRSPAGTEERQEVGNACRGESTSNDNTNE